MSNKKADKNIVRVLGIIIFVLVVITIYWCYNSYQNNDATTVHLMYTSLIVFGFVVFLRRYYLDYVKTTPKQSPPPSTESQRVGRRITTKNEFYLNLTKKQKRIYRLVVILAIFIIFLYFVFTYE